MSESQGIHPLVLAAVESLRADAELELARLRHRRAWCPVSTTGGQNRALSLGKRIREAEKVANGWRTVLAAALAEDEPAGAVEAVEADHVHTWVTALDEDGEAMHRNGAVLVICGVCGIERR